MLENHEVTAEAAKIAKEVKDVLYELKGVNSFKAAWLAAPSVIKKVEDVADRWVGATSHNKKEMAMEALFLIVPIPDWCPIPLVRFVLSWFIERALKELKKRFGKGKN